MNIMWNEPTIRWMVCEVMDDFRPDLKHPLYFHSEKECVKQQRRIWEAGRDAYTRVESWDTERKCWI